MARSCRRRPAGTGLLASPAVRRRSLRRSSRAGIEGGLGNGEAGGRVTIEPGQPEWDLASTSSVKPGL